MAEIKCRTCESPDCHGCNMYSLEQMLIGGKLDGLMNENHAIQTEADVRPVVRGKWKKRMEEKETPYYKSFTPIWSCSECGTEYDPSFCMTINFCPNCGADMREES